MNNKIPTYTFETTSKGQVLADVLLWDKIQTYNFNEEHAHEFNEIMIFIKGGGTHFINNQWKIINDFEFHILPAQFTHILNRSVNSKGFTIAFSNHFLEQLLKNESTINLINLIKSPTIVASTSIFFSENRQYIKELIRTKYKDSIFYNLVSLLILKIAKEQNIATKFIKEKYNEFGLLFMKMLNENYKTEKQILFYSNKMGVCKTTLNRELNKYFKKSFKTLLNEKLIAEAKQLLLNKNLNIAQIVEELGFYDTPSFSHTFKKYTSLSPKQFQANQKTYK